jgi:hypothetical protein
MTTLKTCTKCGQTKTIEQFHRDRGKRDGRATQCKQCASAYHREYRKANQERLSLQQRAWREANPERNKAMQRAWREANRERKAANTRKWSQENPDKVRNASRKWAAANPERTLARAYKWREENKARHSENIRRWREENPDKVRATWVKSRVKREGAAGSHTAADIQVILKSQNGLCVYCGIDITGCYTVDHVVPLARGGTNWSSNIQLTCLSCNCSKHAKTHEEYIEWLKARS